MIVLCASQLGMGFGLLIVLCLCLCYVTGSSHQRFYPKMVNISDVFCDKFNKPLCNDSESLPYINNRHYLKSLATHVTLKIPPKVKIVVGPKDSGKSEGITQMIRLWKRAGHLVIDLNLKGEPQFITGNDAMSILSKEIMQQLQYLDYNSYLKIHECTVAVCCKELTIANRIIKYLLLNLYYLLAIIGGTIVALFMGEYCTKLAELYKVKWAFTLLILILILVVILTVAALTIAPYFIYEMLNPLDISLQNGDWETLICFLNCMSTEKPENRPILIIRELINFHPETLQECLRAMEKAKEKKIYVPIILETSDNLWCEVVAVKRSSLSFEPYYMQEMTYEEGERDIVRMDLFTTKEYTMIYDKIGGHMGSYQELWVKVKESNISINDALQEMLEKAYVILRACTFSKPNLDYKSALRSLQTHNYSLQVTEMSAELQHLIECNILYLDKKEIRPQKEIMMHAIKEFLEA